MKNIKIIIGIITAGVLTASIASASYLGNMGQGIMVSSSTPNAYFVIPSSTLWVSGTNVQIGTNLQVVGTSTLQSLILPNVTSSILATDANGLVGSFPTSTLKTLTDAFGYLNNVSSTNSYISVSTTTNTAILTFSTSSFGANAFTNTTIPTSYVSSFNGSTGAITGVNSFNGATGTITANIPAIATTTKGIFDAQPATSTPDIMFYTETGFTLKSVDCVNSPVNGNTFTFSLIASSSVQSTATTTIMNGFTCNSTSTIQSTTTFNNAVIPANSIIQVSYSSASTTGAYVDIKY